MEGQEKNLSYGRPRLARTSASPTRGVMFEDELKFKTKTKQTSGAREIGSNMNSNKIQNEKEPSSKNQNWRKKLSPEP